MFFCAQCKHRAFHVTEGGAPPRPASTASPVRRSAASQRHSPSRRKGGCPADRPPGTQPALELPPVPVTSPAVQLCAACWQYHEGYGPRGAPASSGENPAWLGPRALPSRSVPQVVKNLTRRSLQVLGKVLSPFPVDDGRRQGVRGSAGGELR